MRGNSYGWCVLALLFGFAVTALAESASTATDLAYAPVQAPPPPSAMSLVVRLFGMTLFVLLLCAAVLWGIRQMKRRHVTAAVNPAKLRLIEEVTLNGNCSMQLVQAGDSRVLFALDSTGLKSCQLVDSEFSGVLAALESHRTGREFGPSVAEMMALLAASRKAA